LKPASPAFFLVRPEAALEAAAPEFLCRMAAVSTQCGVSRLEPRPMSPFAPKSASGNPWMCSLAESRMD
jgi:hypothetical protein